MAKQLRKDIAEADGVETFLRVSIDDGIAHAKIMRVEKLRIIIAGVELFVTANSDPEDVLREFRLKFRKMVAESSRRKRYGE